ncbi:TPA: sugar transferase [Streptococcus suis]|nr:sugar transferase [Streptococcus suis]
MKVHITNLYGQSALSVALMAQNMVCNIAKQLDMKEIGIYFFNADGETPDKLAIRFDGMNAAIGNGDIVIFQAPSWNGTYFDLEYIRRLKIYSNLKIIIFIHDNPALMFSSNAYLMPKIIEMYNLADLIIAPSQAMLDILYKEGLTVKKTLIQEMWDHTTKAWIDIPPYKREISFAGNPQRFPFVNEWSHPVPLNLFSNEHPANPYGQVHYKGWHHGEYLLRTLNETGGFGLVWAQGLDAEYYNINVSYKLSTYLAAGIPVIVPETLSNAHIIKDNHLGFVVSSLEEAAQVVEHVTEEDYRNLVTHVLNYRNLLTDGYYSKKLLIDAVHAVLTTK